MRRKINCLSGSMLKVLAAIFMVCDHVGLMFFPTEASFRIIGRLAFPIFAFLISEGARYTKNKVKYFSTMFGLAFICQVVYFLFDNGSLYMCILVTFSVSLLLIYVLKAVKQIYFGKGPNAHREGTLAALFFLAMVGGAYLLTLALEIDYGFAGIMTPVMASLFDFRGIDAPEWLKKLDNITLRVLSICPTLALLTLQSGNSVQIFCFASIPLLLLYSGSRGKYKLKYFFYLFYPLHLVLLEAIYILIVLL